MLRLCSKLLHRRSITSAISYEPIVTNPVVFMDVTLEGDVVGRVSMELFHDSLPQTAENFRSLCTGERNFSEGAPLTYKGVPFHRVVSNFVVQGGDIVHRDGRGNQSIFGYKFPNESINGKAGKHLLGTIAMASHGPNGNGSQFFFNLRRSEHLDEKLVVFGQVLDGWDVVERVARHCGTRSGTPVSRAWVSDCGQSGGLHYENTTLLTGAEREAPHGIPVKEVLDVLRPRF
ncbi:cyclophilin type peptidyl-prolyl cis-trans isomerase, putative [Bodo saltans]|uniref:Peptidyl-prolyl cis-trans isomerase n=1 Tax=Bodo saltans TaxID=75058 RepID=A0A0S4J8W7_BODSA|nr:cyclophilin type peptidyl-prolyl cis-trans isomerase, putative [Bodo saltans]|eukprot:CUG86342.1 cyclophilin type peptidyl-prolyl cis-trans isomerase, putative [Bodo saltans]